MHRRQNACSAPAHRLLLAASRPLIDWVRGPGASSFAASTLFWQRDGSSARRPPAASNAPYARYDWRTAASAHWWCCSAARHGSPCFQLAVARRTPCRFGVHCAPGGSSWFCRGGAAAGGLPVHLSIFAALGRLLSSPVRVAGCCRLRFTGGTRFFASLHLAGTTGRRGWTERGPVVVPGYRDAAFQAAMVEVRAASRNGAAPGLFRTILAAAVLHGWVLHRRKVHQTGACAHPRRPATVTAVGLARSGASGLAWSHRGYRAARP